MATSPLTVSFSPALLGAGLIVLVLVLVFVYKKRGGKFGFGKRSKAPVFKKLSGEYYANKVERARRIKIIIIGIIVLVLILGAAVLYVGVFHPEIVETTLATVSYPFEKLWADLQQLVW